MRCSAVAEAAREEKEEKEEECGRLGVGEELEDGAGVVVLAAGSTRPWKRGGGNSGDTWPELEKMAAGRTWFRRAGDPFEGGVAVRARRGCAPRGRSSARAPPIPRKDEREREIRSGWEEGESYSKLAWRHCTE